METKKLDMIKRESIASEVYTVAEIQKILNISKNVAYDLVKENLFPVIKIIKFDFGKIRNLCS